MGFCQLCIVLVVKRLGSNPCPWSIHIIEVFFKSPVAELHERSLHVHLVIFEVDRHGA